MSNIFEHALIRNLLKKLKAETLKLIKLYKKSQIWCPLSLMGRVTTVKMVFNLEGGEKEWKNQPFFADTIIMDDHLKKKNMEKTKDFCNLVTGTAQFMKRACF